MGIRVRQNREQRRSAAASSVQTFHSLLSTARGQPRLIRLLRKALRHLAVGQQRSVRSPLGDSDRTRVAGSLSSGVARIHNSVELFIAKLGPALPKEPLLWSLIAFSCQANLFLWVRPSSRMAANPPVSLPRLATAFSFEQQHP